MAGALRISEAASLALHAVGLMASDPDRAMSVKSIAANLEVSPAHLSKVLYRLKRQGLLSSTRGPTGGFRLAERPGSVTLKQVFEAIEGPLSADGCFLGRDVSTGRCCALGHLLRELNGTFAEHLERTTLDRFARGLWCDPP